MRSLILSTIVVVTAILPAACARDAEIVEFYPLRTECTIHFAGDRSAPSEVRSFLDNNPNEAIRKCKRFGHMTYTDYTVAGPITTTEQQVCHYEQRPIFLGDPRVTISVNRAFSWVARPDESAAYAKAKVPCPPQFDESYAKISAVGDDVIIAISRLWQEIVTSEDRFDGTFQTLDCQGLKQNLRSFVRSGRYRDVLLIYAGSPPPPFAALGHFTFTIGIPDGAGGGGGGYFFGFDLVGTQARIMSCYPQGIT